LLKGSNQLDMFLSKCNETHIIFLSLENLRGRALPVSKWARKDPLGQREERVQLI
jgi:hypothetical protein